MEAVLDVVRFAHYGACFVVFGASLFRLIAGNGWSDSRLRPIIVTASIAACLSAGLWLALEAGYMADDWASCARLGVLQSVLDDTLFGHVWRWRMPLALALIFVSWRGGWWPMTIAGGCLLASLAGEGHSVWTTARGSGVHFCNQMIHLLAAGAWLGALVPLRLLLGDPEVASAEAMRGIRQFSRLGYVAVALVLVTGAINSVILGSDLSSESARPWLIALAIKLLLVAAMCALALANRIGVAREWSRARLYRSIGLEIAIGALVLAVACILGTLAPPRA